MSTTRWSSSAGTPPAMDTGLRARGDWSRKFRLMKKAQPSAEARDLRGGALDRRPISPLLVDRHHELGLAKVTSKVRGRRRNNRGGGRAWEQEQEQEKTVRPALTTGGPALSRGDHISAPPGGRGPPAAYRAGPLRGRVVGPAVWPVAVVGGERSSQRWPVLKSSPRGQV